MSLLLRKFYSSAIVQSCFRVKHVLVDRRYKCKALLLHSGRSDGLFRTDIIFASLSSLPNQSSRNVAESSCSEKRTIDVKNASDTLANLSAEDQKRLKVLRLEYDVFFSTGVRVPDNMTDDDWLYVLQKCQSFYSRRNYYSYLFKKEKSTINQKRKSELNAVFYDEKRRLKAAEIAAEGEGALGFKNTFLLRILDATMNRFWYNNLSYAMMHGPRLVFDFSYESHMSERELTNLCTQMQLCHQLNKQNREPFHFHFCNVKPGSATAAKLQLALPNLEDCLITVTDRHYTELFAKERLVYLSPNAPKVMGNEFDVDDVFVIGAIVDKAFEDPITLARAKEEKLRTVRFPLDNHVRWTQGSKSLALNHVTKILLEFKTTQDWKHSLVSSLPIRKYAAES